MVSNIGIAIKIFRGCGGILKGAWLCLIESRRNQDTPLPHYDELFIENLTVIEDVNQLINLTNFKDVPLNSFSVVSISILSPVVLLFSSAFFDWFG